MERKELFDSIKVFINQFKDDLNAGVEMQVFRSKQDITEPVNQLWFSLEIDTMESPNIGVYKYQEFDDQTDTLTEYEQSVRDLTISLKAYGEASFDALNYLKNKFAVYDAKAPMSDVGLEILSTTSIADLNEARGGRWEQIYDMTLMARSSVVIGGQVIDWTKSIEDLAVNINT